MSETNSDSKFIKRAATASAAGLLLWAGGAAVTNAVNEAGADAAADAANEQEDAYVEVLKDKLHNGEFTDAQVIGQAFTVGEGEGYETASLDQIANTYGDEQFKSIKPLIYDQLLTAAKYQVIAQPGENYVLVEDDIDGDGKNEYLPVKASQVKTANPDSTDLALPETDEN